MRTEGYNTTHGGFWFGERDNGWVSIVDFAIAYELVIVNSLHKKKEDHLVTFKSDSMKTQTDYFLIGAENGTLCKDCKVIPSEYLGIQHRLLVMDVKIKSSKARKTCIGDPRVRWWNLTNENTTKLSEKIKAEGSWRQVEDADPT